MVKETRGTDLLHRVADGGGGGGGSFDEAKVKRDAKGQFAKKADKNPFTKDAQKELTEAFVKEFGEGVVGGDFESYLSSLPASEQESTLSRINEITKEVLSKHRAKHSGLGAGYFAAAVAGYVDALHYGIRGMKWGVRRSDAQLARDTAARKAAGDPVTPTEKSKSVAIGEESSASRYARLQAQAKSGGAGSMSEADLKFFNARTEALAKVNKMYQQNPSWLKATSNKVLQQAAQNTMQSIADGVAKKYITTPILENLEPKKK